MVSDLLRLFDFCDFLAISFSLFSWNELHISFMHFVLRRERGEGMSSTFLGIC
jgi:hypothetical protein